MKITHINTSKNAGGAAIACNRISSALNANAVQSNTLNQESFSAFTQRKIHTSILLEKLLLLPKQKSKNIRFKISNPQFGIDISSDDSVKDADILHLHWINNGFLSISSLNKLAKLNKPIVWTLHDMWAFTGICHHSRDCNNFENQCGNCFYLNTNSSTDLSNSIWKQKQLVYKKLNLSIVTCSNWLAQKARKSSLLKDISIQVIPNPIDVYKFKPFPKLDIRSELGLLNDTFYLLFVAANINDERKGIQHLLKALTILKERYSEKQVKIELLVIGNVKSEIKEHLPFRSKFLGYIDSEELMIKYYNASNTFITPSLDENLPNTIMEALSCGTPVVAYSTGGIPDMVDHLSNGYLAEYASPQDLAEGIDWVRKNNEMQISANARNKVLSNFTYDIVAQKYIDLYKKLL
ncbi:MAG: glycosyltransferase family 4 protein [Bacteroidetes bacterium]|nr:glycosyltransferase family 4 protein [Bacteroidota bacterium]